jgi:hypothetical protein
MHQHVSSYHLGVPTLMAHVRVHHLFLGLRAVARSIVAHCLDCRRRYARPMNPPAGLLPFERVTGGDAFRFVGADFLGPILLPGGGKRWVLLFTCISSRAVHLELMPGIHTTDVWTGLRRIFARRGVPHVIYTNNGRSFVRVSAEIEQLYGLLEKVAVSPNVPSSIRWKFSSPIAPWQGGFFERLVGMVKSQLPVMTSHATFNQQKLQTILVEVEAVLNSRPIGELDDGTVLTPGHLLIGKRPLCWPGLGAVLPGMCVSERQLWFRREAALDTFWSAWRKTYLAVLQRRFSSGGCAVKLAVGRRVLLHDESSSRSHWKVGVIREVLPGRDGVVRNVLVDVDGTEYRRAVQRLSLLEGDAK